MVSILEGGISREEIDRIMSREDMNRVDAIIKKGLSKSVRGMVAKTLTLKSRDPWPPVGLNLIQF